MYSITGRIAFVSVPMTLSSFSYMLRSELKMPGSPPVNWVTSASHRFANSCAFGSGRTSATFLGVFGGTFGGLGHLGEVLHHLRVHAELGAQLVALLRPQPLQ